MSPSLSEFTKLMVDYNVDAYLVGMADYQAKVEVLFPSLDIAWLDIEWKLEAEVDGSTVAKDASIKVVGVATPRPYRWSFWVSLELLPRRLLPHPIFSPLFLFSFSIFCTSAWTNLSFLIRLDLFIFFSI